MVNLSVAEQENRIQQLREQLGNQWTHLDDEYLVQFLIARSWNVDEAKTQLENTFKWRAENGVDHHPVATTENQLPVLYSVRGFSSIPDSNLEASAGVSEAVLRINQYMGGSCLHKTDIDGCPIYIERLGYHAAKDIAKKTTIEEVQNYHIGCNEFLHRVIMKDCSLTSKKRINRETVIFDCAGMGWHQFHMPALQYIRAISDTDQKYYPETLNKLFIVNAPSAFVYVWKIFKGWLDPGTIEKIQICGSDYQTVLLKQIPAENLPDFLGGQCKCEHMAGGCVPSQVLKNVPPMVPQEHNEKTPMAYNDSVMQQAKVDEIVRGPPFYHQSV